MFNFSKWFRNSKVEEPVAEPVVTVDDIDLDFFYEFNGAWGGNFARNAWDSRNACDVRDCVRPSSYTVLTTAIVDVDIPGVYRDRNIDRKTSRLPTFQEYHICDRCFRDDKDEVRSKSKYVAGPQREYDPDQDEKTQKKLARKPAKSAKKR